MIIRALTLAAVVAALTATSSLAATVKLNVVGGQLLGASNVDVSGTLYDVEFIDGTCAAIFDGCDDLSDFDFLTRDLAQAAVFALFDTVFVDGPLGNFDSDPTLTAGVEPNPGSAEETPSNTGAINIPYDVSSDAANIRVASAWNGDGSISPDVLALNIMVPIDADLSTSPSSTYARFTEVQISPIPLPAGGVLLTAGLAGLGAFRARRKPRAGRAS